MIKQLMNCLHKSPKSVLETKTDPAEGAIKATEGDATAAVTATATAANPIPITAARKGKKVTEAIKPTEVIKTAKTMERSTAAMERKAMAVLPIKILQ